MQKIERPIYHYIEYVLHHYTQYKADIAAEREAIIEASPPPPDGLPKGSGTGNPTESKGIRLNDSLAIMTMERNIRAIDSALRGLSGIHVRLFKMVYIDGRDDIYRMCDELHISYETFYRYKKKLIREVGRELGLKTY